MLYREAGQFHTSYAQDSQLLPLRQDRIGMAILLIAGFVVVPFIGNAYWLTAILIPWLTLSLVALGQNILMGYAGQLSLGAAGFMAAGAFACYNLILRIDGLPFIAAVLLSGLCAALIGIVFGLTSLRVRGLYLMVATLGSQFFIVWALNKIEWFVNYDPAGVITAQNIVVLGYEFTSPAEKYLVVISIVSVLTLLAANMARGSPGRAWMAVRDMDIAAELIGIRPLYAKLTAFAVSSFIIGVAGALWAFVYLGSWEPLAFSIDRSLQLLFMVIIGGLGSIMGSFVGAAFILILPILLNLIPSELGVPLSTETITHLEFIIFGSLICYLLIKEPHGFARLISLGKEKLRLWPFPY
jgi:branched-chain amino acid transport system permease protein